MVASTSRFWRRYVSARRSGVYSWASSTGSEGSLERAVRADRLPGAKPSAPERLTAHDSPVTAVAAGTLSDRTPVIVSGGEDGVVRVWRLADGTPVGEPLPGHDDGVCAVAAGALPDGTPVIISGGGDGTVRVWRLADGTPIGEPLHLPESVRGVAVHGNIIVTAAGTEIAVHQLALPRPIR